MDDGQRVEEFAARYLESRGFEIIARKWKTYWCEVDIVAKHKKTVHVVEVKHRKKAKYGEPLEYITDTKKQQLRFATHSWATEHK